MKIILFNIIILSLFLNGCGSDDTELSTTYTKPNCDDGSQKCQRSFLEAIKNKTLTFNAIWDFDDSITTDMITINHVMNNPNNYKDTVIDSGLLVGALAQNINNKAKVGCFNFRGAYIYYSNQNNIYIPIPKYNYMCNETLSNGDIMSYLFNISANGKIDGQFAYTTSYHNMILKLLNSPDGNLSATSQIN